VAGPTSSCIVVFGRTRLTAEAFAEALGARTDRHVDPLWGPLANLVAAIPAEGATVVLLPAASTHTVAARALLAGRRQVRIVEAERSSEHGIAALAQALDDPAEGGVAPPLRRITPVPAMDPVDLLSGRQQQVLELLAAGATNAEAAAAMGVSVNTLRFHIRGIYQRLGVHGRAEAVGRLGEVSHPPLSSRHS
jgi:DNA-binding NarL/FixJ family response regulator